MKKREVFSTKAFASYLQISILIIAIFAFSYALDTEKGKIEFGILDFILEKIREPMLPLVSAVSMSCCRLNNRGSSCNDYESSECSSSCQQSCLPTSCEDSTECRTGCCYDASEGICSANTPKVSCESGGGLWRDSVDCNTHTMPECRLGCCILGQNTMFVTSERCQILSAQQGRILDFRAGVTDEASCIALSLTQVRGACVLNDNSCRMLTNSECRTLTGRNVVQNKLCTSQSLNTSCEKTRETTCVAGKDEVYFLDSCGNPANIYDSSRYDDDSYWEQVFLKGESCGTSSDNANTESASCGNCNYLLGSRCKNYRNVSSSAPEIGGNICASMACEDAPSLVDADGGVLETRDRKNGESWCIYDGKVGDGDDVVGSRHYRFSCIEGEVIREPCADFRNEICVERDTFTINGSAVNFATAACRLNSWQECIDINTQGENVSGRCEDARDCFLKDVNIADNFRFDLCLPRSPEGFDLRTESSAESAEALCGLANVECTVVYESDFGGCEPVVNEDCLSAGFGQKMNDVCRALGDCGGEVNIAGEYTANHQVKRSPDNIDIPALVDLARAISGQKIETDEITIPGVSSGVGISEIGEDSASGDSGGGSMFSGTGTMLGVGALGVAAVVTLAGMPYAFSAGSAWHLFALESMPAVNPAMAAFGNAAVGAGIGMIVGSMLAQIMGVTNPVAAVTMALLGGAAGVLVAAMFESLMGDYAFCSGDATGTCFVIVTVIIVIMVVMGFLFGGDCDEVVVKFECKPWQAPLGGDDCDMCNNDEKECSKYRCQSLGQACMFLNEGSGNEICVSAVNDHTAPEINPLPSALNENFTYTSISSNGFEIKDLSGECIEAFTPVKFGIQTSKISQCKHDFVSRVDLDSQQYFFGNSNLFLYNHTMTLTMPSTDFIMKCLNSSSLSYQDLVNATKNLKVYTRCQDVFGNYDLDEYLINICVKPGPDRTAPLIIGSNPVNGGFIAYNSSSQIVAIQTNEPAQCKYSRQDKSYSEMENNFTCHFGCEDAPNGWRCGANLTGLSLGENNFFIRCRDQPWFESTENESLRNENAQSYQYTLKVTQTPLTVTNLRPNGTIMFGSEPGGIDLGANTAGGADGGRAVCYYLWDGDWIMFYSTGSQSHLQRNLRLWLSGVWEGSFVMPIKCEDSGRNIAYGNATFNLALDSQSPRVVRVYNSAGSLYIATDEASECSYSNRNCGFIFENGTRMSGGFTKEHSTSWDTQKQYYIKCRDAFNNEPSSCSIKLQAYNSGE